MNKIYLLPIAFLFLASTINAQTPPTNMKIFVLMGQSNMSANGDLAQMPKGFPRASTKFRIWNYTFAGKWVYAREPMSVRTNSTYSVFAASNAKMSPGVAFADTLATYFPTWNIGLVPCTRGGTSVASWQPSTSTKTLYGACMARIKEAAKKGEIAGVIWFQGSTDARTAEMTAQWKPLFENVFNGLRNDIKEIQATTSDVAFIITEEGPVSRNAPWVKSHPGSWDRWHQIRTMQRSFDSRPMVAIVTAKDLKANSTDMLHLTTASLIKLGQRYASTMQKLLTIGGDF